MANKLYKDDLPAELELGKSVAVDTEAMGLQNARDRLCLVQISSGDGNCHMVQFAPGVYAAPNLVRLLGDASVEKIYHFARFDLAILQRYLGVRQTNVYCTRTASKFIRTYTDNHGLKVLCEELLGIDISKKQQSSYWGNEALSDKQLDYAAHDVLYLHRIKAILDERLRREGRWEIARQAIDFLPVRAELDLIGWQDDIFAH